MLWNTLLMIFFSLIVAGCASDRKMETMESSGGSSSTAGGGAAVSSPAKSDVVAADPNPTSPTVSSAPATESKSMNQSRPSTRNRIAAGVDEETMDTCLASIPEDATAGQKMLAEQTCRRNYAPRPY